jgi:hypothetical protein
MFIGSRYNITEKYLTFVHIVCKLCTKNLDLKLDGNFE